MVGVNTRVKVLRIGLRSEWEEIMVVIRRARVGVVILEFPRGTDERVVVGVEFS